MSPGRPITRRVYVSGAALEFWEDPDRPFGCAPADLRRYADAADRERLFNALALHATIEAQQAGS